MTDSGKSFTDQHDEDEIEEDTNLDINNGDPVTPLATDDDQNEVSTNDVDDLYKSAFGNDPDGETLTEAIDNDEKEIEENK
ncbi:hypothetical protein BH10PAT1_BH10PAT1_7290 [soil metagenome]